MPQPQPQPPRDELSAELFGRFIDLIYRRAGIRIPATKRVLIANRVRRRLVETGIPRYADYYTFLVSPQGRTELPRFLDEITTNETYFYRDKAQYDWLGGEFLPDLARRAALHRHPRRLRVWSAACSTGEELYSVALQVTAPRSGLAGWSVTLVGTDLSSKALELARAARYDERALRLVPPADRERFFDPDPAAGRWAVKPEFRKLAHWKHHNLLEPLAEPAFDCVFLKNVLIYFDANSKRTVVKHLLARLAPGGYLVVGPTEGVHHLLDGLTRVKPWLFLKPAAAGADAAAAKAGTDEPN
jgi:chemotaxis protein methyltransferase CheR